MSQFARFIGTACADTKDAERTTGLDSFLHKYLVIPPKEKLLRKKEFPVSDLEKNTEKHFSLAKDDFLSPDTHVLKKSYKTEVEHGSVYTTFQTDKHRFHVWKLRLASAWRLRFGEGRIARNDSAPASVSQISHFFQTS